ncbi:MAG: GntR family transcriptional regulator, partial [Propionibacteriaceae bacterium]|nr:GntR family transcriptional regulator [Propionibacteriaceae bacterium]
MVHSESTKYEAVAAELRARVHLMQPDESLPTERRLAEEFTVSRTTVRQAIRALIAEGLIYNVQGSGTYVAPPGLVSKTLRLTGFSQDMRQRGLVPSSRILVLETVAATGDIAAKLGIPAAGKVFHVWRLRAADGAPMALEHVWLPEAVAVAVHFQMEQSLYDQLEAAGYTVARAAETIDAVNVDAV